MKSIVAIAAALSLAGSAGAQSLYESRPVGVPQDVNGIAQPSESLVGYSMFVIAPPPPKRLEVHDLVTIIVNETSRSSRSQSLETEKDYSSNVNFDAFLSLSDLVEGRLVSDEVATDPLLEIDSSSEFEGEGAYERSDRLTARIQAEVIDIKPNGVLVLEAKTTIQTDEETQVFVLAGNCRSADVTEQNTVQSSQLHNLSIVSRNEGEVRKSSKKGYIPRVLETVFSF